MYLQVTTKCNMRCPHCMFACTSKGHDMSLDVVKAAGKFVQDYEGYLFLGGGEPTLHPQFWEIVGLLMKYNASWSSSSGQPPVGLVTNGKNKEIALALAKLAESGAISCALSHDQYHERIDERVVNAFKKTDRRDDHDYRDLRTDLWNIRGVGRGRKLMGKRTACDECDLLIDPKGDVWRCSCKKECLGNICDPKFQVTSDVVYEPGCSFKDKPLVLTDGCWHKECKTEVKEKV